MLSGGLDIHRWSDYEDTVIDFNICKQLNMTLYSLIYPSATLKQTYNNRYSFKKM